MVKDQLLQDQKSLEQPEVPDILKRLMAITLNMLPMGLTREDQRRFRIAVTQAEYDEIRKFMLSYDGGFYARVRNYPLVIEEQATHPPIFYEEQVNGKTVIRRMKDR